MNFKDTLYLLIFMVTLTGGMILVDAVAEAGGAHSFVRDMTE